jgi:hypothetical protein
MLRGCVCCGNAPHRISAPEIDRLSRECNDE